MLIEKEQKILAQLEALFPKMSDEEKTRFQYTIEGMALMVDHKASARESA